ncbi:MAG: FMN-binding protein [Eubacterium sp.]
MKSNFYKENVAPVVVLVVICLIVSAALAVTYGKAHPVIVKNAAASANQSREELLPKAKGFKKYTGKLVTLEAKKVYVSEAYTATNNSGEVITVVTNSFGGPLTMMVGVDNTGAITNVKVTDHSDTPGVGTKNWNSKTNMVVNPYKGVKKLNSTNVKDGQIKYISGASVTGEALHKGVYCALQQVKSMGGAK